MMNKEHKILLCWVIIFMMFDAIDLITTAIGLSFPGVVETNVVTAQLFPLGIIGYLLAMLFTTTLFTAYMFLMYWAIRLHSGMVDYEMHDTLKWMLYSVIGFTIMYFKFDAIINNIGVILSYL